ncbi:antitoxin Xre/MbcA/ParS toxin-binding domain-containing protein [Klebsiella variicola]|uniref:MbcA/ParS/Xre antitoxin family protein n=1 Tax=Klebsiella variicola TaxID=244366 RepID=UPI000DAD01F2|nr:DUF2384 domain-containing protein [Klebsiella pneumoniae]EKU8622965.1 DUF2384 domain-containing protein [Klebsiella variicola]EKX8075304.1 DUF2384 domain-containing protein [Escherichia coli]HCD1335652.1 DUF2384 domain-containing protein [Klebsiella variicola subsp. variicola]HDH1312694.1 DUF2384 domain-containing protein [Klebsiella quasipneumoniae subsp. similipneumoniae]
MTKDDVLQRAIALFEGDNDSALKWFNEPNRALRWKIPAELIDSEEGALMVSILITRIEHGVCS